MDKQEIAKQIQQHVKELEPLINAAIKENITVIVGVHHIGSPIRITPEKSRLQNAHSDVFVPMELFITLEEIVKY